MCYLQLPNMLTHSAYRPKPNVNVVYVKTVPSLRRRKMAILANEEVKGENNEPFSMVPEKLLEGDQDSNMAPADYVASLTTDDEVAAYYGVGNRKREEKFQERLVQIRRVTKVVKGGKQLRFRAIVVIGDEKNQVGVGVASAKEVIGAVAKAVTNAKRGIITVPVTSNHSIPHRINGRAGASVVMLRPASEGTGVVAGGAARVVLELAGL